MEKISTIEWYLESNPEREKSLEAVRRILSICMYMVGPIVYFIFFVNDLSGAGVPDLVKKIVLAAYFVEVAIWHLSIKDKIRYQPKMFTLTNEYLDITNSITNKTKHYQWKDFKSFSRNPRVYNPKAIPPSPQAFDKSFFLGTKNIFIPYVTIVVDKSREKRVYTALKVKLEEK